MDVQELIRHHGLWVYVFTFIWTFFEGETFVLFCGFAAAQGLLNAPLLLVGAWLGSFAGDQFYFWVGRHFGLKLLERRPVWRARVDKALVWLRRFDIEGEKHMLPWQALEDASEQRLQLLGLRMPGSSLHMYDAGTGGAEPGAR